MTSTGRALRIFVVAGEESGDQLAANLMQSLAAAHDGPIDVAFRPVINTFRGRRSVELHMVDWQVPGRDE